jgi:hypothetical protein
VIPAPITATSTETSRASAGYPGEAAVSIHSDASLPGAVGDAFTG